jgi:hypothetical protein
MKINLKTKSFTLNELTSTSCYINYCSDGTENNDEIQFVIKDGQLQNFVTCLASKSMSATIFAENNTKDLDTSNPIIAGRIEGFRRIVQMVREIQAAIIKHADFNINDFNK